MPIASFHITFQSKEIGGKEGRKGKGTTAGQTNERVWNGVQEKEIKI